MFWAWSDTRAAKCAPGDAGLGKRTKKIGLEREKSHHKFRDGTGERAKPCWGGKGCPGGVLEGKIEK